MRACSSPLSCAAGPLTRPHSLSRAHWAFRDTAALTESCVLGLCCRSSSDLSAQETAGLGFMSGGVTGVVTTPIDVVRTQMVLSGGGSSPLSFGSATLNLVRSKGLRGLFRGGAMRSLEIALGGAVFFSVLQGVTALMQGPEAPSTPDAAVVPPAA